MQINSIVKVSKNYKFPVSDQDVVEAEKKIGIRFPPVFRKFILEWWGYNVELVDENIRRYGILFPHAKPGRGFVVPQFTPSFGAMVETVGDSCLPKNCLCFEHHAYQGELFVDLSTDHIWFFETDIDGQEMDEYYRDFLSYEDACDAFDPKNGIVPTYFTKIADNIFDMLDEKRFVIIPDDVPG
ncbi:hypothetical protein WH50_24875 [Pokkaliibacter plantistimulans]|uniref:Knr4/Smi1-like domain-containing protein n=1 Tax=Pokkaliibacter plantistimulans TaxID=1635171 RepID=A0ABX5LPV8_9GAMM|nr:SMI1/KNR4 family protein [Pokkaliibacter plantistimulans]PXF28699.1 hypothetical protein WH50_24875 [Pokkaliibacter plantistimulans]